MKKKLFLLFISIIVLIIIIAQTLFPGRNTLFAITLTTGIGIDRMQKNIDLLENKAIQNKQFTVNEKAFLHDLYTTMANGAKIIPSIRQSGLLLEHYLFRTGEDLEIDKSIFMDNKKVQKRMTQIKKRIRNSNHPKKEFHSKTFHMPDKSSTDSIFGLYWGKISAYPTYKKNRITVLWRAQVPWKWPSYPSLKDKYGNYHAESFPLPNLKSMLMGKEHSLFIDNGLGEHLTKIGLAKSFTAYAEWTEEIDR